MSHKTIKYTAPLQGSFSIIHVYRKKISMGWDIKFQANTTAKLTRG